MGARVFTVAAAVLISFGLGAAPVSAHEGGGRGADHGDADRPHERGPESSAVDYAGASWLAAHKGNYTNASRPKSDPINKVVIHTMQGTVAGTKAWFRNPKSEVTTHYLVSSSKGSVTQMVHESDIAWHAGNWDYNKTSIGIEHEGYVENPKKWYTKNMYASSAKLVRSICDRYGIPKDRKHIIAHSEVPGATHTDPGKGWNWDRFMDLVRDGAEHKPITMDNDSPGVTASAAWKDGKAPDGGRDYRYATPVAKSDPLWYTADLPATGRYRVEVRYPAASSNNTKTPYVVPTTGGFESVYVDQTTGGDTWRSIGSFTLKAGKHPVAGVSRWTGGDGRVVADGVRLIRL